MKLKSIRFHRDMLLRILGLGLPAGLQSSIFSISNVIIQSSINSFGYVVMAGNSAAANLSDFIYIAMNSVYHTCLSFTSQNYGAKNYKRVKKVLLWCTLLVLMIGVVFSTLIYGLGPQLLSLYIPNHDPDRNAVLSAGMVRLTIVGLSYCLCGIMEVLCGCLRGLGKAWTPLIISTMGACVFRIIWIATVFASHRTLEVLYYSYPISWVITPLAHLTALLITFKKECRPRLAKQIST